MKKSRICKNELCPGESSDKLTIGWIDFDAYSILQVDFSLDNNDIQRLPDARSTTVALYLKLSINKSSHNSRSERIGAVTRQSRKHRIITPGKDANGPTRISPIASRVRLTQRLATIKISRSDSLHTKSLLLAVEPNKPNRTFIPISFCRYVSWAIYGVCSYTREE
jgi:hypothetical protein